MKHIPILFSTEMVQAILDGRKKMARRKLQIHTPGVQPDFDPDHYKCLDMGGGFYFFERYKYRFNRVEKKSPYSIGDILWVRESFATWDDTVAYKTDIVFPYPKKWKPSIHMPKSACRIFLRVTDVRCERLQEIDDYDAILEGVKNEFDKYKDYMKADSYYMGARGSFRSLWASINGQKSWDANPYVWVVSFERCERPADFLTRSRTDTRWFHDYIYMMYGVEVDFIKGRLKFGDGKNSAPFPSMVVVFKPCR